MEVRYEHEQLSNLCGFNLKIQVGFVNIAMETFTWTDIRETSCCHYKKRKENFEEQKLLDRTRLFRPLRSVGPKHIYTFLLFFFLLKKDHRLIIKDY